MGVYLQVEGRIRIGNKRYGRRFACSSYSTYSLQTEGFRVNENEKIYFLLMHPMLYMYDFLFE